MLSSPGVLLLCHAPAAWDLLRAVGFRSFEPTIADGPFDNYTARGAAFPCDFAHNSGTPYTAALQAHVASLLAKPSQELDFA